MRHIGVIGIYVFTQSPTPINVHSDIHHGIGCIRYRNKFLQFIDPVFRQSTRKNHTAQIAVQDLMVQTDSSPELNKGVRGSVALLCKTGKGYQKATKALIDMKSHRKRNLEMINKESIKMFTVKEFKALTDPMTMSVPDCCALANDNDYIMKRLRDPVVL